MKVYQFVDEYRDWDGICNDLRGIKRLFQDLGIPCITITNRNYSQETKDIFHPLQAPPTKPEDILILHYGGSGYPLEDYFERLGRKWLRFHNITPPYFFYGCRNGVYLSMEKFYTQSIFELSSMENQIELSLCDSKFNEYFLKDIVNIPTTTMPIVQDYTVPNWESSSFPIPKSEFLNLIFIGRIVPNKKIEDLIFLVYFIQKYYRSKVRLRILGNPVKGIEDYYDYINELIVKLQLTNHCWIQTNTNNNEKVKILKESDFFVSMSEHEGFCIPLLEAMEQNVPVIAFESSAVPETLKGGGFVFKEKNFPQLAEFIEYIIQYPDFIFKVLYLQKNAMEFYKNFPFKKVLSDCVNSNLKEDIYV